MGKWDVKTLMTGTDVARDDRLLISDQSQTDGSQDRNIDRSGLSFAIPKYEVTETSHGFSVGDAVRFNGTNYVAATADTSANAEMIGLVVEVIDTDTFVLQQVGFVTGLSGLTAGEYYYLQDAGGLGTSAGTVAVRVLLARAATTGWLLPITEDSGGGAGGGLDSLSDASVTSATQFEVLEYDGSNFANVYPRTVKEVRNQTGSPISAGTLVEITSATGSFSLVSVADKDSSGSVAGITLESIGNNAEGVIQVTGTYDGIDTSGLTAGDDVWLGDTGGFTTTPPTSGTRIRVGKVGIVAVSGSLILATPAFPVDTRYLTETVDTNATSGTAATLDCSAGTIFDVTLTDNCTISMSNVPAGGFGITIILQQDGTGSRTVTWPAAFAWAGGTAPTLSAAASAVDVITAFTPDGGTTWYAGEMGLDFS